MHELDDAGTNRDLVVIGASAGGVEALKRVVSGIPPGLPAAVCVVLHLAPGSHSALAHILERAGPLPCCSAVDGAALRTAEIVVAPPDRHLVIEGRVARLTEEAPESGHRPAVNALFRSAAAARAGRVVGVILSGTQDDGAAGLAVIKERGGATIVQSPADALYPGMPTSALARVEADAVAPSDLIGEAIGAILRGEAPAAGTEFPAEHRAGPATSAR
jgi:two-component system chemotaxis response regulator CheB